MLAPASQATKVRYHTELWQSGLANVYVCAGDIVAGFLCSECSDGYYRLSNTCRECPVYAAVVVGFMVPAVLGGLITILMCLPLTEKTRCVTRTHTSAWP